MKRLTIGFLLLVLAGCASLPIVGGPSQEELQAPDGSYSLRLPPGWSIEERGVKGEGGKNTLAVLARKAPGGSGRDYPTVVVSEFRDATPAGYLDVLSKDKGLELAELWNVSKEKYQLKQVLVDDKGQLMSYWLVPRDGQGVEYYGAVLLTRFGRIEMVGLCPAGSVQQYLRDLNTLFTSVTLDEKARIVPGQSGGQAGDIAAYLTRRYQAAMNREIDGLKRAAGETRSFAQGGNLAVTDKGILDGAYTRAVSISLDCAMALERMLAQGTANARSGATWQRQAESLDGGVNALETIALNIRDQMSRQSVEKTAAKARKLAELVREVGRLP